MLGCWVHVVHYVWQKNTVKNVFFDILKLTKIAITKIKSKSHDKVPNLIKTLETYLVNPFPEHIPEDSSCIFFNNFSISTFETKFE